MKLRLAITCVVLCLGLAPASLARESAEDVRAASAPFENLRMAAALARWGREHRDPWALAEAARIRMTTPQQYVDRIPEGQPKPAGKSGQTVSHVDQTALGWLDEAESLGGGDPRLSAVVQDIRATTFKGRTGGPRVSFARLPAGGAHHYGEPFDPRRPAVVYVEGDGDTDLALTVTTPDGSVACSDHAPGDVKLCAWRPDKSGAYRVEVANHGRVDNRYALSTN